jgi:hypothetical protein
MIDGLLNTTSATDYLDHIYYQKRIMKYDKKVLEALIDQSENIEKYNKMLAAEAQKKGAILEKIKLALWLSFAGMILIYATYFLWSKINIGIIQKVRFTLEEYTRCHKSLQTVTLWTFLTHACLMLSNIFAALATYVSFEEVPFWYWFIVVPTTTLLSFVILLLKVLELIILLKI